LQNACNPSPNDKDIRVPFVLCSQLKHGIAYRLPIKVAKKLYAFCIFQNVYGPKPSIITVNSLMPVLYITSIFGLYVQSLASHE